MNGAKAFLEFTRGFGFLVIIAGAGFSNSLCAIGIGISIGAILFEAIAFRGREWAPLPAWPLAALLLASLAVSVVLSQDKAVSLRGLTKYLEGFLIFYAGFDALRRPAALRAAVLAFALGFFLAGFDGIWQAVYHYDLIFSRPAIDYRGDLLRLTGTFKHSNDYATFLVPGFVLFTAAGSELLRRGRKAAILGAPFVIFALLVLGHTIAYSYSRAAFLALGSALAAMTLFTRRPVIGLGIAAAAAGSMLAFNPELISRFSEILNPGAGNTPERLLLLRTAWDMTMASPVFGLGLNTYSMRFAEFRPENYRDVMYAHNSYLQMSAEAGLLGLGLFMAYVGALAAKLFVRIRSLPASFERTAAGAFWAGMAGFLVNSLFESCFQSTRLRTLFWALAGITAALAYRKEKT